jgi:hypothetical protein
MRRLACTAVLTTLLIGTAFISAAPADQAGGGSCQQSQPGNPPPGQDQLGHPLNYVVLENCQPGSQLIQSQLQVVRSSGSREQPTNLAYAYSYGCSPGCETIAVAYQVVLVDEKDQSQSPQNGAVAINDSCTGCATFAYADQYAVDVPPGTHLSPEARRQIDQIRAEADQDVHANLSFADLDARLKELASELKSDVDNGLEQPNPAADHRHASQDTREQGSPPAP